MARVCAAYVAQLSTLLDPVGQLSRHGLGRAMYLVADTLQVVANDTRGTPLSLGDHLQLRSMAWDDVTEQISGLMGEEDPATLHRQLSPLVSEMSATLARPDLPNTVASAFGTVRLIDYLRANTIVAVELAIASVGVAQPAALAEAVRSLAGVLADRFPGRTIEVRVPPYVAVQMGAFSDGPTHTRGTPPNVVETDPQSFLAVATGRQSWHRAVEGGKISHSGAHAEETSRAFPIFRPY